MKKISITECVAADAMAQIDKLEELNIRNRGCLRLLTEEMFSMVNELLSKDRMDFEVGCENKTYTLRVSLKTHVDEDAREHFLSMSSDGKNAANKGIKGMLGAIIELFVYDADPGDGVSPWRYGMCSMTGDYDQVWALSHYMDYAPLEKEKATWDGMEKSIIANFSDDVVIGVRSGRLEMTVTKAFA